MCPPIPGDVNITLGLLLSSVLGGAGEMDTTNRLAIISHQLNWSLPSPVL